MQYLLDAEVKQYYKYRGVRYLSTEFESSCFQFLIRMEGRNFNDLYNTFYLMNRNRDVSWGMFLAWYKFL